MWKEKTIRKYTFSPRESMIQQSTNYGKELENKTLRR